MGANAGARAGNTRHVNEHIKAFAVLRFDDFASGTGELRNIITVIAVVPTLAEAQSEVDRLSALNAEKDCRYFWTSTRYYPSGRSAGATG
jgi:hypothetical protein